MSELYLIYLFIVETVFLNEFFHSLDLSSAKTVLSPANVNKLVCLKNWLGL